MTYRAAVADAHGLGLAGAEGVQTDAELARVALGKAPSEIARVSRQLNPPRVELEAARVQSLRS